ncbi:hypothetical protein D3C72_1424280 [compost metagenome]
MVSFTESPLSSGSTVCTEPLPKVRLPITRARLLSRKAPASTSDALAEPASTSTTTGASFNRSPGVASKRASLMLMRPRVLTMLPLSSRSSATCTAAVSRPPGLLRRSSTSPLRLPPDCFCSCCRCFWKSEPVSAWKVLRRM